MVHLKEWADKHAVSVEAMRELADIFTGVDTDSKSKPAKPKSEAGVTNDVRLEGGRKGVRLFRNNVGASLDVMGRLIRYGLANESKAMNKRVKSSDLIGIRALLITPEMVGSTVGQFVAREVKPTDWVYRGNDHELAQLAFMTLIVALGGDACFTNHDNSL
jgi:hypothetical protein